MSSPITLKYPIPKYGESGYFGTVRKHDIHTGIDLYCDDGDEVFAIEDGVIVAIEKYTGEWAGSPWWNNTSALLVEGESGVICYGEITPLTFLCVGDKIIKSDLIGHVAQVLRVDKGKNPPSMLHLELYTHGTSQSVWWRLGEDQPVNLLNPIILLNNA